MMFGARLNKLGAAVKSRPPTASFNFALAGQTLDSRITFSRASSATYFDNTGTLQTASSGVARANAYQDHNPTTLAPLGFLIEEARTNSNRNNTMVGAVAGTPGTTPTAWSVSGTGDGLTRTIVGTGTEDGIAYIDVKYTGTTSAAASRAVTSEAATQVSALAGQTWTGSAFIKLAGGSLANVTVNNSVNERSVAGTALVTSATSITPTTSTLRSQRASTTRTLTDALTAFVTHQVSINYASGVAVDITLRIGLPQLEQGAFATSPILTTTAAATRLADVATITGASFSSWYNAVEGTMVASADSFATGASVISGVASFDDGTSSERIQIRRTDATSNLTCVVVDGGVVQANVTTSATTWPISTSKKEALAYKQNDFACALSGVLGTTDTGGTLPTVDRMVIGGGQAILGLNGHIQSLTYYNKRLSNATLQALTV